MPPSTLGNWNKESERASDPASAYQPPDGFLDEVNVSYKEFTECFKIYLQTFPQKSGDFLEKTNFQPLNKLEDLASLGLQWPPLGWAGVYQSRTDPTTPAHLLLFSVSLWLLQALVQPFLLQCGDWSPTKKLWVGMESLPSGQGSISVSCVVSFTIGCFQRRTGAKDR